MQRGKLALRNYRLNNCMIDDLAFQHLVCDVRCAIQKTSPTITLASASISIARRFFRAEDLRLYSRLGIQFGLFSFRFEY